MFKPQMKFEYQINGRDYVVYCDNDSPSSDMKEVACQIIKEMILLEDRTRQKLKEEYENKKSENEEIQKE